LISLNLGASRGCLSWSTTSSFQERFRVGGIRREDNDG
jgi:hypothetical protein